MQQMGGGAGLGGGLGGLGGAGAPGPQGLEVSCVCVCVSERVNYDCVLFLQDLEDSDSDDEPLPELEQ